MVTMFRILVADAVKAGRARELADEFEAAPATMWRWASGVSTPLSGMQKEVLAYLARHPTEVSTSPRV